jgi:PAS domain S-box-containing protein
LQRLRTTGGDRQFRMRPSVDGQPKEPGMVGKRKSEHRGGWKQAMPRFLSIFLGSALLILAIGVLLFAAERERRLDGLAGQEESRLRLQAAYSEQQLQQAAADLLGLARNETLQRAGEQGVGEGAGQLDRQEALTLAHDLERFATAKPACAELALYGRKGRELMHLELGESEPVAVFPDSGAAGRNRSPVDLDELPAGQVRYWQAESGQPRLLLATGVRAGGRIVGSLVFGLRPEHLLGRTAEQGGSDAADLRILDRRGRSLLAVASGKPSTKAYDPSQASPELWSRIHSSAEGQHQDGSGLTSYRSLNLGRPLVELTGESAPGGLKLVAHVSGAQVTAAMRAWIGRLVGFYIAALVVLALGAGLLAFWHLLPWRQGAVVETGRERHERFLEDSRDLVLTAELEEDATGTAKLIAMNRAATELFGFDAAEIAQMSLSEIAALDSLEALRRHLGAARAGRAPTVDLELVSRNGKVINVELLFQRAVSVDGESTVLRGTGRDVSHRKRLEKSVQELEQLLDLQTAASAALHETDNVEGALAAVLGRPELDSSGWVALYAAVDAQQPLERVAYRVVDSKDKQAGVLVDSLPATLPDGFRPFAAGDRPFRIDLQAAGEPPFGKPLPALHAACWLFPLGRAAGAPGALLVFTRNNGEWSARRQDVLRQVAGACGQSLARRHLSAGLAAEQAALQTSRSETAKAEDTLPTFLTRVADRLRRPARRLVEEAGHALEAPGGERAGLEAAAQNARGLLRSIEEILSYAELEAGHLEVAQTEFVWRDLVREALDAMAEAAMRRGLTLRAEIEKQIPPRLIGDAPRVRQVLDQLLGNALRFTEQGEVVLKVQLARETAQGVSLHFTVHDTGCGIPDEQQNSLFAPFGQEGVAASRRHKNGGLGLSLASRLVRAMNGTMWMQSVPGQGSNFHFTCPFGLPVGQERPRFGAKETPAAPTPTAAPASVTAAPVHVAPPPSLRVLVAEESESSRLRLSALMTAQGHRVQAADSAITAIELLAQQDFDAVFMSAQMRDMDGLTATRAIRDYEKEGAAHLPVVAMSAEAMAGDRARCEAAGMDHYLSKPIDEKELLAVIARLAQGLARQAPAADSGDDRKDANVNVDMDLSVFDRAAALDRVGGDLELLIELAGMFMEDYPQLLAEIEGALRNGDSDALRQSAHTLKGAVGNFSAQNAYDAAYALEQIGRSGDLSDATGAYRVLKQELERLQPLLGALV